MTYFSAVQNKIKQSLVAVFQYILYLVPQATLSKNATHTVYVKYPWKQILDERVVFPQ